MADYRGFVTGPSGETLAATTVSNEQLAAANVAETARINRAVEAREQQEAAARAERERAQAALGAAELADYHDRARSAWLGSGGTTSDFAAAWPALRTRYLTEKTVEGLSARDRLISKTRQEMLASGRFPKL